jgi:hypothetical protein
VVEDSFETLREDRVRVWLRVKKKGKEAGRAVCCPQFPISRFDEIAEIWMVNAARRKADAARHKAAWEARELYASSISGSCIANDADASGSGEGIDTEEAEESRTGNDIADDDDVIVYL